ncbi:hypothetical protein HSACCH_00805 [Halanaerobium saccharolyticum subsp. saccharolyticum DSM 6643]|uniref:Omptin family protein n=1 Tax=Halanaerobium saccharolyticum subsp. saccharolyticum DSM 6643 TaxID=1293054 RepID=M5DZG1_9FIRM|nr:omptin family outer membrane protease [Halanaerobium saccharolyticum]CCU78666.1 hypothetical protein HSACCH_00805 [Halanaerobium saccharolyticum subsp. saccharolyticum DSM 6643]
MKKKLLISLILVAFLFFTFTSNVLAEKIEHQFDISIGAGDGYTEFKIGDVDTDTLKYGFKSLLEFPLDVEMLNLSYSNNFKIPYLNIGGMSIKLEKNLSDDAGTFKDSDWFSTTGMNNKDVIGTSPTEVKDITRWNFKVRNDWQNVAENIKYSLHVGYKQDNYDLLSYDVTQTYLTNAYGQAGTTDYFSGDNITYEATYDIPYLGFGLKTDNKNIEFMFSASYSNWAEIEDEDNHLHRDLTVKGKGEGNSIMLNGKAKYILSDVTNLFLNINYNKTEMEGSQDQYLPDGRILKNIYYEAEQEYTDISLGLNWNF